MTEPTPEPIVVETPVAPVPDAGVTSPAPAPAPAKRAPRVVRPLAIGDVVKLKDKREGVVKQVGTSGRGALVEIPGNKDGIGFESTWFATDSLKIVQA